MMGHALLWLSCIALCSVGFRIRGGMLAGTLIETRGQVSRLIFAAAAGLTAWTGVAWLVALATVPAWWISSTFPLFGGIDLGTRDGSVRGDVLALLGRGALWVVLPVLVLLWGGAPRWVALPIAGVSMPLCYWLGQRSGIKGWGIGDKDWCETAEAIYGAVLGIGILLAVHPA